MKIYDAVELSVMKPVRQRSCKKLRQEGHTGHLLA